MKNDQGASAHTPGPWRTSGAALDGFAPIMAPGGVIVAMVSTLSANVKTDARLIAAAPELLEAVSAFVTRWNCGDRADTDYVASLMKSAHAKATGAA